ncbi:MAG: hypothetical protein OHK0013_43430 [Sandaracinaceae bacterium]
MEAGVADATAPPIALCVPTLDELRASCEPASSDACAALFDERAEVRSRAYVEAVLARRPLLADLRFRNGRWAGRPLSEVMAETTRDTTLLPSLAVAVETAFADCRDHRIFGRPTTTAVCAPAGGGFVEGVEEAPCAALDHACGRGYFDAERGCCDVALLVPGAACEAMLGPGACSETGQCELGRSVDASNVYAWTEVLPARSGPPRIAEWANEDTVTVRVAEVWDTRALSEAELNDVQGSLYGWARFESTAGPPTPVAVSRVSRERHGADGLLAMHDRRDLVQLYLHEDQLGASLDAVTHVLAWSHPVDDFVYLGADGASVPRDRVVDVPCRPLTLGEDGAEEEPPADAISCRVSDAGFVRVAGPGLTGFLLPGGAPGVDVRPTGRFARGAVTRTPPPPTERFAVS